MNNNVDDNSYVPDAPLYVLARKSSRASLSPLSVKDIMAAASRAPSMPNIVMGDILGMRSKLKASPSAVSLQKPTLSHSLADDELAAKLQQRLQSQSKK